MTRRRGSGSTQVGAAPVRLTGVLRRAASAWRHEPKLAVAALSAILLQQLFATAFALSLKLIIDHVSGKRTSPSINVVIAVLLVGFALTATASILGERMIARAAALITNAIRRRLHEKVQNLSAGFFANASLGDVLTRFTADVKSIELGYTQAFLKSCVVTTSLVLNVPILFLLDLRLALLTAVTLPLLFVIVGRLLPRSIAASKAVRASEAAVTNDVQEAVRAQQLVRAFRLEPLMARRFDASLDRLGAATTTSRTAIASISKLLSLGVLLVELLVLVVGARLATNGDLPVSSLVSFMTILAAVADAVSEYLKSVLPVLVDAAGGVARVEEFLDLPVGVADAPGARPIAGFERCIELDRVCFEYEPGQRTLDGVSLSIPAGRSVVFVGESGSGKSTVLSLLLRFYDPTSGTIAFDGNEIRTLTQESLRAHMSVVFQESYLFNTSIRENIRMGRPDASDLDIEAAARAAEIHELITSLPNGYDTVVGEAGGRLSGGQRQRVAIARAVLSQPRILLLDEATSALDPGVEAAVNETLARLGHGRTVIAVTHRLMSAVDADCIFVMQRGVLAEQGTHRSLLDADGIYASLWRKQSGFDVRPDGRHASVEPARLRAIDLFATFELDVLREIAASFFTETYEAAETVIVEGERGDKFFLVVRGQVEITIAGADGEPQRVSVMEEGDHFGDMALLDDLPRNATATTLTRCVLLAMSKDELLGLIDRHPEIGEALRARRPARAPVGATGRVGSWARPS